MLRAAAEQFGNKDSDEIIFVARETLEGHQVKKKKTTIKSKMFPLKFRKITLPEKTPAIRSFA
jgi:hypothetical protein